MNQRKCNLETVTLLLRTSLWATGSQRDLIKMFQVKEATSSTPNVNVTEHPQILRMTRYQDDLDIKSGN